MVRICHRTLLIYCLSAGVCLGVATTSRAIDIVLDYTYDTGYFFGAGNPQGSTAGAEARAAIEAAASLFSEILDDSFSAIETPAPFYSSAFNGQATWTWNLNFHNPTTNSLVTLTDQTIDADEFRIYVGARSIPGSTIGIGGPGGWGWSTGGNGGGFTSAEINQINQITDAFAEDVEDREETSGFATWGGAVTFDTNPDANWHFNHTTQPISNYNDFYSTAIHEIAHAVGFGTSTEWNILASSGSFRGSSSVAEYGGPVPTNGGHWGQSVSSVVLGTSIPQAAAMRASSLSGSREHLTALDAAALSDIGWSVVPPTIIYASADYDTDGDVDVADLAILENWYSVSTQGDADGDGDTDGNDLLTWQRQYTGSSPLVANLPEPTSAGLTAIALMIVGCLMRPR